MTGARNRRAVMIVLVAIIVASTVANGASVNASENAGAVAVHGEIQLRPDSTAAGGTGAFVVPAGVPTKMWIHITSRGAGLNDTINVTATRAAVNVSSVPVSVAPGQTTVVPILVTPEGSLPVGEAVVITVRFTDAKFTVGSRAGKPYVVQRAAKVVPPVAVAFVHPEPAYVLEQGWRPTPVIAANVSSDAPLEFHIRVSNPSSDRLNATEVIVMAENRYAVAKVRTPPLDPSGATTIVTEPISIRDALEPVAQGDVRTVTFTLHAGSGPWNGSALYWLDYEGGHLSNARSDTLIIRAHRNLHAQLVGAHVELGAPSWAAVSLTNFGEESVEQLPIDITYSPVPVLSFSSGDFFRDRRHVTLPAGGSKVVNFSFVPTVGARSVFAVTSPAQLTPVFEYFEFQAPVQLFVNSPPLLRLGLGEAKDFTMGVTSSTDAPRAELGFMVTTKSHFLRTENALIGQNYLEHPPFTAYPVADDVLDITLNGGNLRLGDGSSVEVAGTVTGQSPGMYLAVPYARLGDVMYVAAIDGEPIWERRSGIAEIGASGAPTPAESRWWGALVVLVRPGQYTPFQPLLPIGVALLGWGFHPRYRRNRVA